MKTLAVIALFGLPVLWLAAFVYLARGKIGLAEGSRLAISDPISLVVNIGVLVVSILALIIGVRSYQVATQGAVEQQKSLDASRNSLESVVTLARKQQDLLTQNLQNSKGLLDLQTREYDRQMEREGRKPSVDIALGEIKPADLLRSPTIDVDLAKNFGFTVVNVGLAPVVRPTVIITATPPSLVVDSPYESHPDRPYHHILTLSDLPDIVPASNSHTPSAFPVRVKAPMDVTEFDLEFSLFGENLKLKAVTIHCKIKAKAHPQK